MRRCSLATAAADCLRVPLRCHPGLGRVPAGPRAAGSPAPDRRPPGAANRTGRERAGHVVRAFCIRAAAAARAHPGQVRPAARALRIPGPVLTRPGHHAGHAGKPARARQRPVPDPGLLRRGAWPARRRSSLRRSSPRCVLSPRLEKRAHCRRYGRRPGRQRGRPCRARTGRSVRQPAWLARLTGVRLCDERTLGEGVRGWLNGRQTGFRSKSVGPFPPRRRAGWRWCHRRCAGPRCGRRWQVPANRLHRTGPAAR
jgi:hypothetical protein